VLNSDPGNVPSLNGMGLINLKESRLADAEQNFRTAIHSDPKFVPAYNNLAVTLERENRRKEAITLLQKALLIQPENEDVRKNLERMKVAG
jgi:Flp pilus assembly protein TadD